MKLWQGGGHVPAGSRGSTTRTTLALAGLLLLASLTVSVVGSTRSFAAPATFTVTTTNDSGAGSLRQAITDANSNGNPSDQDVIEFAIAGGGDQTIQPQTPLTITESVLVDGYTQGDAEENTALAPLPLDGWLRVELDLSVSGAVQVNGAGVTLRGLTLNLSPTYAVQAIGADNFQFFGNYVNTDTTGLLWRTDPAANGAVYIEDADNVRIGGMAANQRNVVSWCSNSCIEALATSGQTTNDLRIQGNLIGVGSDAVSDQGGNTVGILLKAGVTNAVIGGDRSLGAGNSVMHNFNGGIDAQDVVGLSILGNRVLANNIMNPSSYRGAVFVGGSTQVVVGDGTLNGRNVVGGQDGNNGQYSGSGVVIGNSPATSAASSEVSIEGNYIGVIDDGITPYENFGTGVLIRDNSNNVLVRSNIIRNSYNNVGIAITNSAQSVAVLQNSIYNNQGIGIDLNGNNIHEINDAGDGDTGSNGLLNSPGYTNITETAGNTDVEFSLDAPAGNYRIEFFSNTTPDSSGIGEGQTYIGFMNITHTGSGLEAFSTTLAGTGHTNLALTATEINPSTPSGFGASSEFGGVGATPAPSRDIRATKRIINPQDKSVGNVLQYEIKITNDGPDDLDLSTLNSTVPGSNYLFVDILPPQLQYSGISGPNITCQDYGPGSAAFFGSLLANHTDHSVTVCAHTGNDTLAAGQTVTYTLSATVVGLTTPTFTNHMIVQPDVGDPDIASFSVIFAGGTDMIDQLSSNPLNNYARAFSEVADTTLTGGLDNPQAVTPGSTLNYTMRYVNLGPSTIDPTLFTGAGINPLVTSIIIGFIPPNLTYLSQSNPDLNCIWTGPNSAGLTPLFANHMDYSIFYCAYTGSDTSLAANEMIESTFRFTTNSAPDSFTSYFIGNPSQLDSIGWAQLGQIFAYSGGPAIDVIDRMNVSPFNNILRASYQKNNPSIQTTSTTSLLSQTGSRYILMILIGSLLLGISAYAMYVRNKKT